MSESWDDYAPGWDSNEAVIAYADKAHQALIQVMDPAGFRVLDFGCGTGLLSERLSPSAASIVALDPAPKMIAVLENKGLSNVATITAGLDPKLAAEHPLLTPGFDLIVASSALAFVPDYVETVSLLKQLLKPGGRLIQWDWLKKQDDEGAGFSPHQIRSAMTAAGLVDCTVSTAFSVQAGGDKMDVLMGVARNN
ncbi:2-polyprenyl-6-hydroxyphenol methylase [Saliniradius amylolyticus]|uniref:2-polyprenyl-6-hydroxyphenol methylase n=1 Tax=Saliniradius amylolyticus TaxID=2183582 RepID=A0A2S2E0Z9_9ALTE|nr:methyltransferase domain-containing protein [Saliniradius amylolyticus]AWL10707.1 2-polyprenyl-6-hydroxyphenol methylase [Saliniradius amylolyticus]